MLAYLIIYIVLGLILRIFGPMAKAINNEVMNNAWKRYFNIGLYSLSTKPPLWKIIIFDLFLTTAVTILWPILLIMYIFKIRTGQSELEKSINPELENLPAVDSSNEIKFFYLDGMKSLGAVGEGIIRCNDCSHQEKISIATHGRDDKGEFIGYYGFQCQKCGCFKTLSDPDDGDKHLCKCGGELSRGNKVFCPRCHGLSINYRMTFMT